MFSTNTQSSSPEPARFRSAATDRPTPRTNSKAETRISLFQFDGENALKALKYVSEVGAMQNDGGL